MIRRFAVPLLGAEADVAPGAAGADAVDPGDVDPELWETPTWCSSGEPVEETAPADEHRLAGLYAWVAGESAMVTGLRRHLLLDQPRRVGTRGRRVRSAMR